MNARQSPSVTERTAQSVHDSGVTILVALREADRCRAYPDRVLNEEIIVVLADELTKTSLIIKEISTMDCLWSASGIHDSSTCQCVVGKAERAVAKMEGRT